MIGKLTIAQGHEISRNYVRNPARQATAAGVSFWPTALLGSDHHDLDESVRIGKLGLDARACRQVVLVDPLGPHLIHCLAIADVGDPNVALKNFGLARPALRKKSINLAEDLPGLTLNVFAQVLGDNPRQVDGLTVLYR
jgi:hypothetical protein